MVFLDDGGRDTLLFQKAKVIQVEPFKRSSQRRSLAPVGGSEHCLVYPDAMPVVWESMMGNEGLGLTESLPQGQMVCD